MITIGANLPSAACVQANANALADYARISQDAGLVPIVEPEVLMDGTHSIARCYEVSEWTLNTVYAALADRGVYLPGTLLKPNMVNSASDADNRADVEEVAGETLRCLKATVPAEVPGIMFLSGGQSEVEAAIANRHFGCHRLIAVEFFETPLEQRFGKQGVRRSGIGGHQNVANAHQRQVVGGFPVRCWVCRSQIHRVVGRQQLSKPAGVGNVDEHLLFVNLHHGRESAETFDEFSFEKRLV